MSNSLHDLQMALLEMLNIIDSICKENDIKYSLACGTALGAIRHQGFIPWDDDLDIMFLRTEYKKFLDIAPPLLEKKGYTLQREFSKTWPMHYSKVRKDNTTYIEDFETKIPGLHQGIFVDLFPIDNLSDNRIIADAQWILFHALVAKEMKKRGYKTNSISKKIAMAVSPLFPEKALRNYIMQKNNMVSTRVHCFLGGAVVKEHNIFPRSIFDDYTYVHFEDGVYPIVSDYNTYLKTCFGDYMKLPPVKDREAHIHAKYVDLNTSYLEYLNHK